MPPVAAPVLILSGPPGAGKTTVARALAERHDRAVALEADRFFDFIVAGFVEPWKAESHAQNATVMQIVGEAAAAYAAAGYFTVVEGIVIPRWFLGPLRATLEGAGHRVAYAVLRAPLDVCLDRRTTFDATVVESIWREFADLGELERNAIDVTAGDVAREVTEGLESRFLLSP